MSTERNSDCLFCKIVAGEIPSEKLYEDERVFGSGADSQHNARFSVGIVFRFGSR